MPHLHVDLAPHRPGDPLVGGPGLLREDAEEADHAAHEAAAAAVERALRQLTADRPPSRRQ